ncbi:MAG: CDP-alcohol phosphatidyltransferase family protein [Gammaproteobacteria bacterium]|nr:CDP-alcohol phosphatidyltransferase family protein [Gammaproteobacteria bacterium]
MKPHDIPNIITVFRFLLVPPVVWLMLNQRFGAALIVFGIAGFSDALDGYLAKRYNWTSRLGSLLDPLADKLLLLSDFITLAWLHWIPLWLVSLVILRDLIIVAGAIVYHMRIEQLDAEPSLVSKLNTVTQILLVLAVMFTQAVQELPALWLDVLLYSVLVTTVWSGLDYIWTWGRRAWQKRM